MALKSYMQKIFLYVAIVFVIAFAVVDSYADQIFDTVTKSDAIGGAIWPAVVLQATESMLYGNTPEKTVTVTSQRMIEHMGGVSRFNMTSALPQREHSVMIEPGLSKVLSTTEYVFLMKAVTPWGAMPDYNLFIVPQAIEYGIGDKGGKLAYVNLELAPNYESDGLRRAFVDAFLDPVLFKEDDKATIAENILLERDIYVNESIIDMNGMPLNTVMFRNGIMLEHDRTGEDVSFILTVSDRVTKSSFAPEIPSSYDDYPQIVASLYGPSGRLYATRMSAGDAGTISISVPAKDNVETGQWRYVIERVKGFEGSRIALLASMSGLCDVFKSGDMSGITPKTLDPGPTPLRRGLRDGVLHHQLGDGRREISPSSIRAVSFGALVKSRDVAICRVDDNLRLILEQAEDEIAVSGWFVKPTDLRLEFADGTVIGKNSIESIAAQLEPDIELPLIPIDEYQGGTAGNDRLVGTDVNGIFIGGRGNDVMIGNGGSNIYLYRRDEGDDTIVCRKGPGAYNVLRFHFDVASEDVRVSRDRNSLKLTLSDGGSVTVKDWYAKRTARLDLVQFIDGTLWDARDLERLARGKLLSPRRVKVVKISNSKN